MLVSIFVGFDLTIDFLHTTGARLPFKFYVFLGLGLLLLVISLRRSIRRWMGIRMTNQVSKFKWNQVISNDRKKRVVTYTLIETTVLLSLFIGYYTLTADAWLPAFVMLFFALESMLFLVVCTKNKFRVGVTSKAILVADREVKLIYFKGLRQVSISQQTIYFDYIQELQLSFPTDCVEQEDRETFFNVVREQIDRDKVLFRVTD